MKKQFSFDFQNLSLSFQDFVSKNLAQLCRKCLPRIQRTNLKKFFWNKVCVHLFVWKLSANNLDFCRYFFGRVVVTAFHMCRGFFPEENIFLKKKWLSKFVFGRWVKALRTFVEKFCSSAFASGFRVCRGSFRGKLFLRKEKRCYYFLHFDPEEICRLSKMFQNGCGYCSPIVQRNTYGKKSNSWETM